MRERVSNLLLELSYNKRITLVLHYLHGYEVTEVAEIVGVKVNTVRGRLRAARKWMRKRSLEDPILRQWIEGGSDET
jgi:RNA polymerase sigma factor (sigma-70 family)